MPFFISYICHIMSSEGDHITLRGGDIDRLTSDQKAFAIEKVREYAKRQMVKAKIVVIEKENEGELDSIGLAKVNGSLYFVAITVGMLVVMDLRSVKNDIVAQLWQDNRYMNLD